MDDLRKEQVNTFIANAGKSRQVPRINYDAFSGKRVRPGDEHTLTKEDVPWIIGSLIIISIFTWLIL